ncbi:MAG: 30S ribosomal protein S6 [Candidatus Omnitrophota bacterium]|nr:30S ribosomal protein S6 [Candidatus Omnitrophota bacterium]
MKKYEAMFIIKPSLSEEERKNLFLHLSEVVTKNNGSVSSGSVWAEKKKFFSPIEKYEEGLYYLMNFSIPALAIKEINHAYKLNENVLRVMITKIE